MEQLPEKIQTQLFRFLNEEIRVEELEKWVYQTRELELNFDEEDYLKLISLDFSSLHARHEIEKILKKYIGYGEYETWKVKKLLVNILGRKEELPNTLIDLYTLYCQGFYFLDNLALGFGIEVQSMLDEGVSKDSIEVQQLVDSFLPKVRHEAERVLSWLEEEKIKIRDEYDDLGDIQFVDKRTALEKEPTAYIRAKT